MPTVRNEAIINPAVLMWAREAAGFRVDEAAKKAQLKAERLLSCEEGQGRLSISQLRKLSNVYKRPLAFFYLPSPPEPKTTPEITDFRRLPDEEDQQFSPTLRLEIRKAKYRREIAIDMFRELELEIPIFRAKTTLDSNVVEVGRQIRSILKINETEQTKLNNQYQTLNFWREAIESSGVLVFQSSIELSQMRGFSLGDFPLPVIVVNKKDIPRARIFTMIHELTHIMLHSTGICDLQDQKRIEIFCNAVAGETLVPTEWLRNLSIVNEIKNEKDWDNESILQLASTFSVSREVILRRLLSLGRISQIFYVRKREQLQSDFKKKSAETEKKGFLPPHRKPINEAGKTFVKLVVDSYKQDKIGLMDVAEYLGVKLKHLPKIEQEIHSRE